MFDFKVSLKYVPVFYIQYMYMQQVEVGLLTNKESVKMAMQARQQQQEVEVEEETFGPMPLNRLEVNTSAV